jgi:hypothetical protein
MARRGRRDVTLSFDASDYELLEDEARKWDRDAWSQARWMVTSLLRAGISVEDLIREPVSAVDSR